MALPSLVLCALAGCAALPSSGPDTNQVISASQGPTPAFRIVDLTDKAVKDIPVVTSPDLSTFSSIGEAATLAPVDRIEVGDTIQVTIFEVGAALFSGASVSAQNALIAPATPTANAEALPVVPVGPDGAIALPYVGRVRAAGRTPEQLARAIESGLRGKSQSPQVIVSVREDVGNTVVMIGDIRSPGRKGLSYQRESLLDMIAMSGGPANAKTDMLVRVTRNGRSVEMRLGDIQSGSPQDITLQPQDRVELIYRPRSFTAFGATGKVSEVPFQAATVSLAEAIARIGGPSDQQADSTGVFIFRADQPQDAEPVVYRLNLKDPREYFVAQTFQVRDKDLIFIANAQSNSWYKFLNIVNSVVSPIVTAKYLGQ